MEEKEIPTSFERRWESKQIVLKDGKFLITNVRPHPCLEPMRFSKLM